MGLGLGPLPKCSPVLGYLRGAVIASPPGSESGSREGETCHGRSSMRQTKSQVQKIVAFLLFCLTSSLTGGQGYRYRNGGVGWNTDVETGGSALLSDVMSSGHVAELTNEDDGGA